MPLLGYGGAAADPEIAFFGSANSAASTTITLPASINAGDLIVLLDRVEAASLPSKVIPTDFTEILDTAGSLHRQTSSYKIAVGTEGGTAITGMSASGATFADKVALVFRGTPAITGVTVGDPEQTDTSGNPTALTCSASSGTPPLVVLGGYGSTGAIDPRTFSTTKDGEVTTASTRLYLAYKIYNLAPADTTIDMDDEGSRNNLHSFYMACSF